MSTVIGQAQAYPLRVTKKESYVLYARVVNSTGDGVIDQTASSYSDPGFVVTRTGVGTYSLAYPACPSDMVLKVWFGTHTGTPNVFWIRNTALAPVSGTGTLVTSVAAGGAAADNNSAGMQIHIEITANIRSGN